MPSALAIFTCRPNSHPFQERHVYLDEPIKIGRSVARCRPAQNNATFDCKVLSRNHALVWFDHKTGKFYLQDTKSSNGTFINSQRLSRGSEESPPCEILSGDIIQFGVDVTENTRKGTVTHGCIVSTIKLFLPDGMEARLRSDVIHAPLPSPVDKVAANTPSMYSQELFQLSQYLQEALHREQMLEQKLATLQRLLAITQEASDTSWQALIDEDRLLSRLEVMGNQLQACSKNQTEDSLRKELIALQEDKHNYETTAKESLRRVLQEKIEVVRKLSEVERSLSNTEDECTHLKEMNERTQEELRELANKYNGAVNEIKDLSDKLKVAEGKQEEIQQKGQAEKKELQHKIDEMEEKEQELQAKIEALQADNDFTNERLTALQVRLEHLQEKTLKECSSLGTQVDDFLPKINGSTEKEHLLSKSGGDCTFIHQFIECQKKLIVEGHLTKVVEETKLSKENQARAKESDLSDTLSPSKEKSSDDTTDAQMDEQDLNEPFAKVSLLKDDLQGAQSEIEAKQEIQHLRKELIEAQELARASKQKCFELQALLEEERKAYRNQVEESSKQIQVLQAQLQRLHINIENLREEKDSEITGTRDELLSARDEILLLHQAAEKAASERDTDIASLQEELKKVRAELERWRKAASEYEKEIMSLQNTFQLRCQQCEDQQREEATRLQGELEKLRKEWNVLEAECRSLKKENVLLSSELQRQEKELHNSQKQSLELTSDLSILQMTRKELENQVGSLKEQHLRDSADLKTLLSKAENQAKDVQKEYEKTQTVLSELKLKFEMTEQEKQSITDELKQCKDNLKLLREKGNNKPWPWMPMLAALVAVTAIVLYVPGLARASP
ncbi:sarcolemmal membrane-associated protein isoform X1 [Neophocaena asiaeorientalis asiaeorientalis]|uniref:Sarcolemmal membrane-associated protein n=5 Tax=Odontoceti TaxID=9722 RepID=A0A2U4CCD1_TURTR|nr:sarcolemmal membrane-associated protein isoform X7 [Tursiops truncatus]XP_022428464.1 sarcolemmal membrane-associated protein isoform X1 [Delphinapterus leucas]XP_024602056.1 sarcolemmal membrane-associated protein isoform X1 [Neophocaena asiaeorientalis asiaeorientalis]XP_026976974.1 sarcolemmal membrane-associated protein isoform X16 [Lagenorhynchus obliquidens]XP_029099479.1 sarcolemmal membrane-associated protein isoform X1 [Monodon monoceros]XP_030723358.1 sarcolemmal membrane-associat